jgi:hypothetical protein
MENGAYNATLRFAELSYASAGRRIFDVSINGQQVLNDLDVAALVGKNAALDRTFPVTVTDGSITIGFQRVFDNPSIAAIEIVPTGLAPPPPSPTRTRTASPTVQPSQTASPSPSRTASPLLSSTPTRTASPSAVLFLPSTRTPTVGPPTATPTATGIPTFHRADISADGCVSVVDFNLWLTAFRTGVIPPGTLPDVNNDGAVSVVDFNLWLTAFRNGEGSC